MKALLIVALAACDNGDVTPDWSRMIDQPKILPYGEMRVPPIGTIQRDWKPAGEMPAITRAVLERGKNRFEIVCAACHGLDGDGDSLVARNMQRRKPPSLHDKPLSPAQLYTVISEGYGLMPAYAALLMRDDRWAVVAYVRTLDVARRMR
jgi:mono/diheme cytochrome c family protein